MLRREPRGDHDPFHAFVARRLKHVDREIGGARQRVGARLQPVDQPLRDAARARNRSGDAITVPYDKATVKDAPTIDPDGELSQHEEGALHRHYGIEYGDVVDVHIPSALLPRLEPIWLVTLGLAALVAFALRRESRGASVLGG